MNKKTNEIREEIKKKEERLKRKLTEREKRNIIQRIERKYRRKNLIRGTLVALGIATAGVGGVKLLTSGDDKKVVLEETEDKSNNKTNSFKESIKINITEQETTDKEKKDYRETINQLLEEYNQKYDTDLTNNDITYLRSKPSYLSVDENENYIYDAKGNTPAKENVDVTGYVYVIINKNDKKIISSIGKLSRGIKSEIKNVDTKVAMDWERNEYIESDKKIDFTEGKTPEQIEVIYESIKEGFEERAEEQERED